MRRRELGLLVAALALGCPKTDQSLVPIGGQTVDASLIDAQPLALLPTGPLLLGQLDAQAMFGSAVGQQFAQVLNNLLPIGPESGFVASRDVRRVHAAMYAMQGADFCAVVQGRFDVDAIRRAADARAQTPSGAPVVRTQYGEFTLYTVANIGFAIVTPGTVLTGNETGMRRALDRLRYGKLERSIAPWMLELLDNQQAAFALVGDLSGQPVVDAAGGQVPFVTGLQLVRVLGNFQAPGMNVVGSLSYRDAASAAAGAQGLAQLQQLAFFASLFASWGLGGRMPELKVAQQGNDVSFASEVDTATLALLLQVAAQATNLVR